MFSNPYSTDTKRAIDLTFDDRFELLGDIYRLTAYSVPRAGTVKLEMTPAPRDGDEFNYNPLSILEISTEHRIAIVK